MTALIMLEFFKKTCSINRTFRIGLQLTQQRAVGDHSSNDAKYFTRYRLQARRQEMKWGVFCKK